MSEDFKILDATDDAREWDRVVANLPLLDVHFTSAYGRVAQRLGGRAKLFVLGGDVKPFILRQSKGRLEVVSAYQYGGATASAIAMPFDRWAHARGVVSEYCCMHPLLCPAYEAQASKPVVVIDLGQLSRKTISRRIRRQLDHEVVWQVWDARPESAARFHALYDRAMDRIDAAPRWRRSREYFESYSDEVGARFFFAESAEGERALLTMGVGPIAYAHYFGGDVAAQGMDSVLYFNAALSLRDAGFRYFHLGGGATDSPDDFLLFYKSGFSDLRWEARRYKRVFRQREAA